MATAISINRRTYKDPAEFLDKLSRKIGAERLNKAHQDFGWSDWTQPGSVVGNSPSLAYLEKLGINTKEKIKEVVHSDFKLLNDQEYLNRMAQSVAKNNGQPAQTTPDNRFKPSMSKIEAQMKFGMYGNKVGTPVSPTINQAPTQRQRLRPVSPQVQGK